MVIRSGGRMWGALVLFRDGRRRRFTDGERIAAAELSRPLSPALRAHPTREMARVAPPISPGVALVDPDNNIVTLTAEAEVWLADLVPAGPDETGIDDVQRALYDAADAAPAAAAGSGVGLLRTFSGRWLAITGRVINRLQADVAVVLTAADLFTVGPAAATWYRLSPRQTEILGRLARGQPTKQTAKALQLTEFTVDDHLEALYRKAEVGGREELLGRLT